MQGIKLIDFEAFLFSLLSYFLVKLVPLWGFALISTTALYLGPFIYLNNKELIDNQLRNLSNMLNQQAVQVKDLATQNAAKAKEKAQAYTSDYSAKAQQYVGAAKQRVSSQTHGPNGTSTQQQQPLRQDVAPGQTAYNSSDFPSAPQSGPTPIADQFSSPGYGGLNGESDPRLMSQNQQLPAM